MKRILGLDLDGTIADHTSAKVILAHELGYELLPSQTTSKALRSEMPEDVYKVFRDRLYTERVLHSPPADGVLDALKKLRVHGWDFVIISRRYPDAQIPARQWIARELGGLIPDKQICFVTEDAHKDTAVSAYGAAVYIDDQERVLNFLTTVDAKILFDPFEESELGSEQGIVHMKHWSMLPDMLRELFGDRTDL